MVSSSPASTSRTACTTTWSWSWAPPWPEIPTHWNTRFGREQWLIREKWLQKRPWWSCPPGSVTPTAFSVAASTSLSMSSSVSRHDRVGQPARTNCRPSGKSAARAARAGCSALSRPDLGTRARVAGSCPALITATARRLAGRIGRSVSTAPSAVAASARSLRTTAPTGIASLVNRPRPFSPASATWRPGSRRSTRELPPVSAFQ
mmetsp:Transcript_25820/g.72934  ORF Transcript_25820/g.72934 Transcript_25820/m.72934 type:complete len:205 (-) Transcript_25820:165-779(-)